VNYSVPPLTHDDLPERIRAVREKAEAFRRLAECGQDGSSGGLRLDELPPRLLPPDFLSGYALVREVHRGGQGVVYEATQLATQRRVAIKLLRSIEPAGPSRRRFEREAELITQLRHQNVISVLDAGEREGAFYLIMEYVDGRPIDEFVAERRPPLRDLLGLFAQICDGVNAAHLRGIIHRDLKPANMLIDSGGLPRVVDFGLAKLETGVGRGDGADASGSSVAPATLTNAGQFIGSLPWASPEQAAGDYSKIDVRSDVYSLGVILYQLLTGGHFPYDVTGSTRDVLNRIVSAEPTRPRAVVVQSSALRLGYGQKQGGALLYDIDHELETITLKCLAKDPARRYQTAGDLATDIRHYLAGEGIEAKRDSTWYVLRKTLRRNRLLVGAAAMVSLALLGGTSLATYGMFRAQDEAVKSKNAAEESQRQAERSDALRAFFQDLVVGTTDPWNPSQPGSRTGRNVTVADLLHNAEERINERFQSAPDLECEVRSMLATAFFSLDDGAACLKNIWRADTLARGQGLPETVQLDTRLLAVWYTHMLTGCTPDMARELYADAQRLKGPGDAKTLFIGSILVRILRHAYQFDEAEQVLHELESLIPPFAETTRATAVGVSGSAHRLSGGIAGHMDYQTVHEQLMRRRAELAMERGRFKDAEEGARCMVEYGRAHYSETNELVNVSRVLLIRSLTEQGKTDAGISELRNLQTACEASWGPDHIHCRSGRLELSVRLAERDPLQAEELFKSARESLRGRIKGNERLTSLIAEYLNIVQRYAAAELVVRDFHANSAPEPSNRSWCWRANLQLGQALCGQQRWPEAESVLGESLAHVESTVPDYYWAARFRALLGKCLMEQGRYADAEAELTRAFERESRNQGTDPRRLRDMAEWLVDLYARWETAEPGQGYIAKAESWRDKLIQFGEQILQSSPEH
jgi:serine/threonine protein kinase